VSIGLPVYNGETFLGPALASLLAQTFTDFELVISDNASTDTTEAICRAHAARDPRVRYHRNPENVGAMRNFNRVFEISRGEYFKWAAHDDVHDPDYLARCVEVLDREPDVVLVHPWSKDIDASGKVLKVIGMGLDTSGPRASRRFSEFIRREHSCVAVFGLVRADVLRRTRLLGNYADCDRVLLAEIGLAGPVREIPDALFQHRMHTDRSVYQYRTRQTRSAWFDPAKAGRPAWPFTKQFIGYLGAIRRAPVSPAEKLRCAASMGRWLWRNRDGLAEDVSYAVRYRLRPLKRRLQASGASPAGGSPK
jgi:glycosyltransferase involved in cell wall biosynthesis